MLSSRKPHFSLIGRCILEGALFVDTSVPSFNEAKAAAGSDVVDGCYSPPDCASHQRVAIVIPYKNRYFHLITLMRHLHPILQVSSFCKRNLDHSICGISHCACGVFASLSFLASSSVDADDLMFYLSVPTLAEATQGFLVILKQWSQHRCLPVIPKKC